MCRAVANTNTHFNTSTSRKNQSTRYPKSEPARDEKISSPAPIVSEAITAPGPTIVSQRKGLRERRLGGISASFRRAALLESSLGIARQQEENSIVPGTSES